MCLSWLLILIGHLYLSGMWVGVASRINTEKTRFKEIGLRAPYMITILGSVV
jgi:hypothetical protein